MKIFFTPLFFILSGTLFAQTENWDNYVMNVNDKPVSIVVNLGLKDVAPAKERPFAIILRIKYPEMDSKGFPAIELADELNQLESELETALQKSNGAWYAGRFTQRGLREFYFYGLDTVGYAKSCADVLAKHPRFPWLAKAVLDRNWANYFEVLYPRNEEKEKMENRKIIEELERKGDNTNSSRPIDHSFYFKSDWHRKNFLKELELPNFQVTEMPLEKNPSSEYGFKLVLRRSDKPILVFMNELTILLSELARKHSGKYDGWSTYVVRN